MEPNGEIRALLEVLRAEGEGAEEGSFGLDPKRAVELLREQGHLDRNALLYLLRALYEHVGGETLSWEKTVYGYRISYPAEFGALKQSTYRTLAEGAFESFRARLHFTQDSVSILAGPGFETPFNRRVKDLIDQSLNRLSRFPVDGLISGSHPEKLWIRQEYPEGRLELYLPLRRPSLEWVVDGISYFDSGRLPVRQVVFDDGLRSDLSMACLPEGERKKSWRKRAKKALDSYLLGVFEDSGVVELDSRTLSETERSVIALLPYMTSLEVEDEVRQAALNHVAFQDVFGRFWSLRELLARDLSEGALLVVSSMPEDGPVDPSGARPVLLWRGDTKLYGEPIFRRLQSGAGYLYSLSRREEWQKKLGREEGSLGALEFEGGLLELKPMGRPEAKFEIELVGKRRGSEMLHLEEPALLGLRLRWTSRDDIARWSEKVEFQGSFRRTVVKLLDGKYEEMLPEASWISELLSWSWETDSFSELPNLRKAALFESVTGLWWSPEALEPMSTIAVMEDRSASLPKELPYPVVLWWNPLFERFGWKTIDVRLELRRAFWKEQGREKWLQRSEATTPAESELFEGVEWFREDGLWLWGKTTEAKGGRVVVWREGRLLGERLATKIPQNMIAIYRDDSFPADDYWSGPDPHVFRSLEDDIFSPPAI